MIKKSHEMAKELREAMRGGEGTVEVLHILSDTELSDKSRLFAKMTLQPGASIGLHNHVQEEEAYYLLEGTALVEDGGVQTELCAGDVVLTGSGGSHSIQNNGTVPLVFLAIIILF